MVFSASSYSSNNFYHIVVTVYHQVIQQVIILYHTACIRFFCKYLHFFRLQRYTFSRTCGNFFLPYDIFFVLLHLLSRAKAVSKKSIAILSYYRNSPNFMRKDRAFMLSLDCVCYTPVAYLQAWDMFHKPRSLKGVWRYLDNDGHEYITSCLFLLFLINIPLEGRNIWNRKKIKMSYELVQKIIQSKMLANSLFSQNLM